MTTLRLEIPEWPADRSFLLFTPERVEQMRAKRDRYAWAWRAYENARHITGTLWKPTPSGGEDGWMVPPEVIPWAQGDPVLTMAYCAALVGHIDNDEKQLRQSWDLLSARLEEKPKTWWQLIGMHVAFTADGLRPVLTKKEQECLGRLLRDALEWGRLFSWWLTNRDNQSLAHRKAMLGVGLALNDRALVERALNEPACGLLAILAESIRDDGYWYETSPGYHQFSVRELMEVGLLCEWAGIDFKNALGGRLRLASTSLFGLLDSTLICPNFGDVQGYRLGLMGQTARSPLFNHQTAFEIAAVLYREPWAGWTLRKLTRDYPDSLAYGIPEPPFEAPPADSKLFRSSGMAALRAGDWDNFWGSDGLSAFMRFGPHGHWHGHQDALALELHAFGCFMATGRGRAGRYRNLSHYLWHRTTLSHSTVVVDRKNQTNNLEGECLGFVSSPGASAVAVRCPNAYPGLEYRRTVILTDRLLVDLFCVEAPEEHTYHYVLNGEGTYEADLPVQPLESLGLGDGYGFLCNMRSAPVSGPWSATLRQGSWDSHHWAPSGTGMRVTSLVPAAGRVVLAFNPTGTTSDLEDSLIFETQGKQARFVTVMEPFRGKPGMTQAREHQVEGGFCVEMEFPDGRDLVCFAPGKRCVFQAGNVTFEGEFLFLRLALDGTVRQAVGRAATRCSVGGAVLFEQAGAGDFNVG